MGDSKFLRNIIVFPLVWVGIFAIACNTGSEEPFVINRIIGPIDENQLIDDTFRINIQTIILTYDIYPSYKLIKGQATINFKMRNGQNRSLIHFNPAVLDKKVVEGIWLNQEYLDIFNETDVRVIGFDTTSLRALEFNRDLSDNLNHTLKVNFILKMKSDKWGFYTDVSDFWGNGNEELFPTINTPHELARHVIHFKVNGKKDYLLIGSGKVEKMENSNEQRWMLDTEREVASITVMFVLLPADMVDYEENKISGVPVRVMSYKHGARISDAYDQLETWIPELITNFGPFPMERGLSIFVTTSGGGMEYYGGTITSLSALKHEVFHMYFGCSTIVKSFRDCWWDEAIDMWYKNSENNPNYPPIEDDFRSDIVGARSPIATGFDLRAYDEGARIMEAVAGELGGRTEMIDFLRYLYQNYTFLPFNTFDFIDYLKNYSGVDMYDKFLDWLYNGTRIYYRTSASSHEWRNKVDMTPPSELLKKIRIR